jgi:hypothetical protein
MQPYTLESLGERYLLLADQAAALSASGSDLIRVEKGLVQPAPSLKCKLKVLV